MSLVKSPKEKAIELIDKFFAINDLKSNQATSPFISRDYAKQCALIYVNGVLEIIRYHGTDIGNHSLLFYKELKQEIEKL